MKRSLLTIHVILFLFAKSAYANQTPIERALPHDLPSPLRKAIIAVVNQSSTQIIDQRMFNYAYYKFNFCKECSEDFKLSELNKLDNTLLASESRENLDKLFSKQSLEKHKFEVEQSFKDSASKDLLSVRLSKTGEEAFSRNTFLNCLDYAKAVSSLAQKNGMNPNDLKFMWTVDKSVYQKMCPSAEGQKAIMPRPFVHTLLAYRQKGQWYAINVEINPKKPQIDMFHLGNTLPQRLTKEYQINYPLIAAHKPLLLAGFFDFNQALMMRIPSQVFVNITASGEINNSPDGFVCK